ncbi:hypothetical protein KMP13_15620 [Epibacterium ulvae]|uniref:hypothetical protein n=1 Tax=Epibacterium ulvae TaxID=1156985 RepID=UPI001BFBFCCF|nr:hypothetical protein [Epibacterium ulvae]MBT8155269.1 hypothetical protein [Epibacterium ulvae]
MRSVTLVAYHLCLRALALLGLPFLVIHGHQTLLNLVQNGTDDVWPSLVLILGTAPLCLFFAAPQLLPRRVRTPNLRELGPFLFIGLGLAGFAVMSLAQAAINGLNLPAETVEILSKSGGALAVLLAGTAGLLALTLCNQTKDPREFDHLKTKRQSRKKKRPSTDELRALRHARMRAAPM